MPPLPDASTTPRADAPAVRPYDPERDRDAVHRIWRETGWLEKGKEEATDLYIGCGRAVVADLAGEPECLVITAPGTVRHLDTDLAFCVVTGVTTSHVARKQGLASAVTARALAAGVAEGALVAGLGMFEQGFYNRLGFGTGPYEHWISFDPATLNLGVRARVPRRVTREDWDAAHRARLARQRGHGACNLTPPEVTRADMMDEKCFGLGYYDEGGGELTHYAVFHAENMERGPYRVGWMVYHGRDELLELMALIEGLGDQVRLVRMREPQGIQLQDFLSQPFLHRQATERSKFENTMHASAYWQMRICDLPACLERTHLRCAPLRFNLALHDPIQSILAGEPGWRGTGGEYVVTLGPSSGADQGADAALPLLKASVGAFTRLWLGARPATGLAVTDDLAGPPELLEALDWAFRLPDPRPDWDF